MSKLPLALIASGLIGGLLLLNGGKSSPGPSPSDAVSAVFDAQESAFRKYSGELAAALRSGKVKSEDQSRTWFDARFGPDSEAAWTPLLTEESNAFGGKNWTAEKHAAHIERYAR
jgi:hypothetical protein